MAEVLDQSEIDALLASVDTTGPGEQESAGSPSDPGARLESQSPVETKTYDFTRPERVSKDHIRALASIHEVFARNFGATLSGLLRTIIDIRVVGVEQLTYSEFVHSLPNPTCFAIVQAPPLEGQMCLEMSPLIVYPIIDRLLGGNNNEVFIPQRPLTSIEWRLINRSLLHALEHLSEVWRNLVDARFEIVGTESNPQLVHIVAPTEVVAFVTFEIQLGQSSGTMSFCIPFNVIESVLSRLTTQSWFYKPKPASELQVQRLTRNLVKSTVGLTTFLGQTRIKLSELRGLRPGDLVQLDKRPDEGLIVQIEGRNKYAGSSGQVRGRRAVRLLRRATADEPL
jgi:flagellar motor switch protein FliM